MKSSTCNIEIEVDLDLDLKKSPICIQSLGSEGEWSKIPPLRILSMDLEAQGQLGHFPDPQCDPCIQIGSMIQITNGKEIFGEPIYVIHALKTCNRIEEEKFIEIYINSSESKSKGHHRFVISHQTERENVIELGRHGICNRSNISNGLQHR